MGVKNLEGFCMKRKMIIVLLILMSICAISHVSANDNLNETVSEAQSIDDEIAINEEATDDNQIAGDNSYRDIQEQINNASEGKSIYLNGSYECDYVINVNKTVEIVGINNASIKWTGEGKNYDSPFFWVTSPNVVLKNITFIGGTFNYGGAITWQGENGTIFNCEFRDCIANNKGIGIGGAVSLLSKNCTIIDSKFTNNQAFRYAGAVILANDSCTVRNCEFQDNVASGGDGMGGALVIYASDCIVDNCTFMNNHATDFGGAIFVSNYTNRIVKSRFIGNYITGEYNESEHRSGGAIYSFCMGLVIDECNFTSNKASDALAGAITIDNEDNVVKHSYFKDNSAFLVNDLLLLKPSDITFNHIVLGFEKYVEDSVYGLNETELLALNNTFEITKVDSSVTFSSGMVFTYGGSGKISVSVVGGILEAHNIEVLGHPEAKIDFSDNVITVSGLQVGKYTLRATITEDINHNPASADLSITVNKATAIIKASKVTVGLKKGSLWEIKLVDSRTGNPIGNMKLTLKVYTGKKYKTVSVTTNAQGIATYKTKSLSKGTHKIVVSGYHQSYNFNTLTSSIKVIKQKDLKFKVKKKAAKDGSTLSITVKYKNKPINGVKLNVFVYNGKTLVKKVTLKTKTKGKFKGVCGWGTNKLTVGNHKIVIAPANIKYGGSKTTSMKIKNSAQKYAKWETKI